jgi:hypothetical protein
MSILPLRAIAFQILFLLVAIAIEARIFRQRMNLDHKTCVRYAATVNLLSVVVGWIVFFTVEPFLPANLDAQLISYLFFDQLFQDSLSSSIPSIIIVVGFFIFFGTWLLKVEGLNLLEMILGTKKAEEKPEQLNFKFRNARNRSQKQFLFRGTGTRAATVLLANACSFSAILLLVAIRLIERLYYAPF